ncbi:CrcB family protein [Gordonia sp. (in: high G+C Gram-positive bacteria)]|uniref:fluoride efflux transporter FluC n=1 Tax=Gordonia sp. (in: high G+C Gram-positive bacteria) TaxID=84139 RepID=UPI0033403653
MTEQRSRPGVGDILSVFAGGVVGTAARWAAEEQWPAHSGQWPVGTFLVNIVGAFVLGALLEGLVRRGPDVGRRRRIRLTAGTGFCGAFTTYSAFSLEISLLGKDGHPAIAVVYALVSVIVGVLAAAAGVWAARRSVHMAGDHA